MKIAKIGVLFLSMTVLMTSVFLTEQAFAGTASPPQTCEEAEAGLAQCPADAPGIPCRVMYNGFLDDLMCRSAVGGDMIQMETTSILAAGAQYTAAWMIPTLIAAAGIGIVIARKF